MYLINSHPPCAHEPEQVVEKRLRTFDKAGARVRDLMLERMVAVLARLRTFKLIEGGRRSTLSAPPPPISATVAGTTDGPSPLTRASGGGDNNGVARGDAEGADDIPGGGGSSDAARGKENEDLGGSGENDSPEEGTADRPLYKDGGNVASKDSAGTGSGAETDAASSEVVRWLQFRTADLVSFLGGALQIGDIQAASVVWRRHGRTDRGAGHRAGARLSKTIGAGAATAGAVAGGAAAGRKYGGNAEEGRRLELALPGQLATVPAVAPPVLLGAWLRDEVLPWLDVVGVMAVSPAALRGRMRKASEEEGLEFHGALLVVR